MVIALNLGHPPALGNNLLEDVRSACCKMGVDLSFSTTEKAHPERTSLYWVIGIGGASSMRLEKTIASTVEKLSFLSDYRIPICITVEHNQLVKAGDFQKQARVVWTVLSDPRSSQLTQPPNTPGILWVGSSSVVERSRNTTKERSSVFRGENKAGIRIAKIISQLSQGKEPPASGTVGMPLKAMIEVCRTCNLSCVLCPVGNSRAKQLPPMTTTLFRQVIDSIAPTVWKVKLYNYGEPMLHPRLPQFIRNSKEAGIEWVEISTNGTLLKADLGNKLLSGGLDFLRISIDGINQNSYSTYRQGGDVDQVWSNLREFRKLRDERCLSRPVIEVQCLATCYTEDDMDDIRNMAMDAGADAFRVKTFNAYMSGKDMANLGRSFLPRDGRLSRYSDYDNLTYRDRFKLSSCHWLNERIVVNADGTIVPCCYDFNAVYPLGSFVSRPDDWWWSPERQCFVERLAESPFSIAMCARCPVGVPSLTADRVERT